MGRYDVFPSQQVIYNRKKNTEFNIPKNLQLIPKPPFNPRVDNIIHP
jgi:hypothetical protein